MKSRFLLLMILAIFAISYTLALPVGPDDISEIQSQRWSTYGPQTAVAEAGNVTELVANATTITRTWQGYYGNITGRIVLGNLVNQTLYDWSLANPQGEIYAVRNATIPTWTAVACANQAQLQDEDLQIGVQADVDEDAVNRTFQFNFTHPTFYVGSVQINADDCAGVGLFDNTAVESPNFKEVLLADGTANYIYTAILSNTINPAANSVGFDGGIYDFQMMVGDDGHGTNTEVSTYYFYLELE